MDRASGSGHAGAGWVLGLLAVVGVVAAGTANADSAAEMRALHERSTERLERSVFGRPLWIESSEAGGELQGHIHARVDHPFATLEAALGDPAHWCELMVLMPNIRQCRVSGERRQLAVRFARRYDQPAADGYAVRFDIDVDRSAQGFLHVVLHAERGPVGTHDYRLSMRAARIDDARSFVHVQYGYSYGVMARLGAAAYLASRGRDKVGFSPDEDGTGPIGGLRGAIERNAMRLYLAIDAYLDALTAPAGERHVRALRSWLDAIADYPRQLQEADPQHYFEVKRERV